MGLDNGIEVKKRKDIEFRKDIIDEYGEVCYWRKCWNIRKDIIEYLGKEYPTADVYEWKLDINDIESIINILSSYNEDNWEVGGNSLLGGSIWEWDEIKHTLQMQIEKLKYLVEQMKIYGDDIWVSFYDSY